MDVGSFCNYLESLFQQPEILSMFAIYHHNYSVIICNINLGRHMNKRGNFKKWRQIHTF